MNVEATDQEPQKSAPARPCSTQVLMNEGQKSRQPGSLLIAALGMGQMVTVVQRLVSPALALWSGNLRVKGLSNTS